MNKRVAEVNRKFEREQALAHDAAERGISFRLVGLERQYFCPFQLRYLDDTWTIAQSKKAIRELIAKARGLDPKGIVLSQQLCALSNSAERYGRVHHYAFSAKGSLIWTIYHGPRATLPEARQSEWEIKDLRKVSKRLGIEGKLLLLEPVVLVEQEIRDQIGGLA